MLFRKSPLNLLAIYEFQAAISFFHRSTNLLHLLLLLYAARHTLIFSEPSQVFYRFFLRLSNKSTDNYIIHLKKFST